MTPEEVLAVARAGEKLGCTEALFSLGDKPELIFPEMRETLRHLGYKSTLHYLEAMCELVLRENDSAAAPQSRAAECRVDCTSGRVSPSMGLMLETTNVHCLRQAPPTTTLPTNFPPNACDDRRRRQTKRSLHHRPADRHRRDRSKIASIRCSRSATCIERYGHIQEVIVQNFRVKPAIPMAHWPEPSRGDMLRTVAVARLLMPEVNIQAPPNLSAPYYEDLLDAGINDWGGVSPLTPDFINPEKPWPHVEQLRLRTEAKGCELRQRLPVYPEFIPDVLTQTWSTLRKTARRGDRDGLPTEGGMICVLTGGTGGAKFVDGLRQVVPPKKITSSSTPATT